jgi:hypothetical protein
VFALPYRAVTDVFDLDRIRAFLVGGLKAEALSWGAGSRNGSPTAVVARTRECFDGAVMNDVLVAALSTTKMARRLRHGARLWNSRPGKGWGVRAARR